MIKTVQCNFAAMKAILIPTILIACQAFGQVTAPDSIQAKELNEVTVVANNQRADSEKTVYIPNNRQRTAASDGVSLLARMNIPQLDVNPLSESVKTADNQGVSLFINYHQATKEDVAGLNPQNVKRVEYYDFPTDPRFMRAQHAVNFVTKGQTFGGYTKISGKERFFVRSGNASVYSKFSYKAMEYDVMANGEHDDNSHIGNQTIESYKFPDNTSERVSCTSSGKYRERNIFAALRASWNKADNFSFRNLISIRRNRTPINNIFGKVEILPEGGTDDYASNNNLSYLQFGWESDIYALIGKGWSLNGNVQAEFDDNKTGSIYDSGETSITNNAQEHNWAIRSNFQINKTINDKFSLFATLLAGGGITKIKYSGSNDAQNRFKPIFGGASVGVSISLGKLSGSVDGGIAMESSTINGKTINDNYPFTHVNLQYVPNQKNTIGVWFQYAAFSPDAAMKNPNMIQQNELLYLSGNPELHSSKHIAANLSYTFLPNNMWQLSAYATMFRIMNRHAPIYLQEAPGGMMLKKYYNDGDYNHGQVGVRLSGKFLSGKLAASVAPRLLLYYTTGTNSISRYPFCISTNIDYYAGAFFFNIYWSSANSYVDGETCYYRKLPSEYSASAGWSGSGWNIQITAANIFHSSWKVSDDIFQSKWFDSQITQFGSDYHRKISLTVSYTFNYGRKLNAANELRDNGGGSSYILR